jgi:hypothetical protein
MKLMNRIQNQCAKNQRMMILGWLAQRSCIRMVAVQIAD